MLSSLGVAPVSGKDDIFVDRIVLFQYYILTMYQWLSDVLSSLSSMNSLTPEQSANATPDASLQPSSINSAQRYFYHLLLDDCIVYLDRANFNILIL